MKNSYKLHGLTIACCAMGLLGGCSSMDGDLLDAAQPSPVRLSSQGTTRAIDSRWDAGDRIGVSMTTGGDIVSVVDGVENKLYFTPLGDGMFQPKEEDAYYPANGSKVDITAYYPYSEDVADLVYSIDLTQQARQQDIDVLFSDNLRGVSKTKEIRNMVFRHMLSRIELTLNPGEGLTPADLAGAIVKFGDVTLGGNLDLVSGALTAGGTSGQITALTSDDGRKSELTLWPETPADAQVSITLHTGLTLSCPMPRNLQLEPSKKYVYTMTLTPTKASFAGNGVISPWETVDGDDQEAKEPVLYSVGDYYPDANNPSTAIGIVYWLDSPVANVSSSGKVVSLGQSSGAWGKKWGIYPDMQSESQLGIAGITDKTDGEAGTRSLIAARKDLDDFATSYKAFAWVHTLNAENAEGRWYIPAKDELQVLKDWYNTDRTGINAAITAAGGNVFSKGNYWTSTETDYDKAHYIEFEGTNSMSAMKSITGMRVRAISKF